MTIKLFYIANPNEKCDWGVTCLGGSSCINNICRCAAGWSVINNVCTNAGVGPSDNSGTIPCCSSSFSFCLKLEFLAAPGNACTLGVTLCTGGSACESQLCVCPKGLMIVNNFCAMASPIGRIYLKLNLFFCSLFRQFSWSWFLLQFRNNPVHWWFLL